MATKKRSRALFVGRFQPFHRGHLAMVEGLLTDYSEVIIAIGSAQYSHTTDNPFTASERYEMIHRTLTARNHQGYVIIPVPDIGVHGQWVAHLRALVPPFDIAVTNDPLSHRLFHEAGVKVDERPLLNRREFSGTEVRRRILEGRAWEVLVPDEVANVIGEMGGVARIRAIAGLGDEKESD